MSEIDELPARVILIEACPELSFRPPTMLFLQASFFFVSLRHILNELEDFLGFTSKKSKEPC